jgi:hypothetical protein
MYCLELGGTKMIDAISGPPCGNAEHCSDPIPEITRDMGVELDYTRFPVRYVDESVNKLFRCNGAIRNIACQR